MSRTPRISVSIAELMAESERHAWTLEDLHVGLARSGTTTNFSSVFRAVEKLVGDGVLRKLTLEDGRACVERASAHHDHLHCTRCDTLVEVPCVIPRRTLTALEARAGIAISEHRVIFIGLCRRCRATSARRPARSRARR